MLVVAGLGNPGTRYAYTRHNAGFAVVSALAEKTNAPSWREKFHGDFTRCTLGREEALLLRPMTFMNESGRSVQAALAFFRVDCAALVVVHDELDLPFGTLRLKAGGGHAGHNGLRSIVEHLGVSDFVRLRVGIGRPPRGFTGDVADFVLSEPTAEERAEFPLVVDKAVKALLDLGHRGVTAASNALNVKPKAVKPKLTESIERTNPDSSSQGDISVKERVAKGRD